MIHTILIEMIILTAIVLVDFAVTHGPEYRAYLRDEWRYGDPLGPEREE